MTYRERKEKEQHLLCLIKKEWLISLEKIAVDFNCSERTLKRMLFSLREDGYNIVYCKKCCKYLIRN